MSIKRIFSLSVFTFFIFTISIYSQGFDGYYQYPDINGNKIVFSAEGDLWTVSLLGGLAQRLTTHAEQERFPKFSPDGKTIAYTASYEGPNEIYTIPIEGGLPTRWTYESDFSFTNCWINWVFLPKSANTSSNTSISNPILSK